MCELNYMTSSHVIRVHTQKGTCQCLSSPSLHLKSEASDQRKPWPKCLPYTQKCYLSRTAGIYLINRNTFLESVICAVYLAGCFHFWSHAKVKVILTYLPHQNPAAMVCHCPVQCTEDIFKLRQQLQLCRMAIYRRHASLCTPRSWQGRMVCTDGKWYKW